MDIRSDHVRDIMDKRLDLAVEKGCDGVVPDNKDGYSIDAGFDMTKQDQISYDRFKAEQVHSPGFSVGLKNGVEMIDDRATYYDFSMNEQCAAYNECEMLRPFIDSKKQVLNVEHGSAYLHKPGQTGLCDAALSQQFSMRILPLALDDSFRIECR